MKKQKEKRTSIRRNKVVITIKVGRKIVLNKTMYASDDKIAQTMPLIKLMESL